MAMQNSIAITNAFTLIQPTFLSYPALLQIVSLTCMVHGLSWQLNVSALQGISYYYETQRIITAITKSYHNSSYYFKCNACTILILKFEGKRPLGSLKHRWEENIKIDIRK
jgi:hypothetical protein